MGTRSLIGLERPSGQVEYIYCHWDGYPSHNGAILNEHYPATQAVEALLALGDISVLAEEVGEKHDFDYRTRFSDRYGRNYAAIEEDPEYIRLRRMCVAYGRDRGEDGTAKKIAMSRAEFLQADMGQEFYYLWSAGDWLVAGGRAEAFRPLSAALEEVDAE